MVENKFLNDSSGEELIRIEKHKNIDVINARDLWEFLGSKTEFAKWITRRVDKYEFIEGEDYWIIVKNDDKSKGRPEVDYYITIEMAKELCMVENNEKGRIARKYFIACEKKLKNPELLEGIDYAKYMVEFSNRLLEMEKDKQKLEFENNKKTKLIEEQKPKIEKFEQFLGAKGCIDMDTMAKLLCDKNLVIGRNRLFEFLRLKKILRNDNKPYQSYIDKKYFKITTIVLKHNNEPKPKTLVTPKGAEFIYELAKKHIINEYQYNLDKKYFEII